MISPLFKLLTFYYSVLSFFKRKVKIKNIKETDLVLDVGSGDKPHWRADVIVDKYLFYDKQRYSGGILFDKKKTFIEADVENLPFKDKVFDFVFCAHLLEHVPNPDKAIKEITRVAKRGYIEIPHACFDLPKPFLTHLWFCDYEKGKLIFHQRSKQDNFYTSIFKKLGEEYLSHPLSQYLFAKNYQSAFISVYFKGEVASTIIKTKDPYVYRSSRQKAVTEKPKLSFYFYKIFYFLMTSLFYKKRKIIKSELLKK